MGPESSLVDPALAFTKDILQILSFHPPNTLSGAQQSHNHPHFTDEERPRDQLAPAQITRVTATHISPAYNFSPAFKHFSAHFLHLKCQHVKSLSAKVFLVHLKFHLCQPRFSHPQGGYNAANFTEPLR